MPRLIFLLVCSFSLAPCLPGQTTSDPVSQALSQGDLYFSKHKYQLAFEAYNRADKLSHHSSAACYIKRAILERKLGGFSLALDDAKHAEKLTGSDKGLSVQAHQIRASLLAQMAGKSTDKKLKEAEDELRQALALDPSQPLTYFDLGMVLLKQEHDPEGIAELNAFVALPDADPKTVAEARRIIANPIRGREPFAPDFSFTTADNQQVSNAALRGKVVLLDFWATWCPPCRESLPTIRNIDKKYGSKQFQLISISGDDDQDVWRTFTESQHMSWPEYIDLSNEVQGAFKVDSIPTYVVLDKDGVIRFRQSGFGESTQSDLEEAINKALKRPSDPTLAAAAAAELTPSSRSEAASTDGSHAARDTASHEDGGDSFSGFDAGTISANTYKNEDLEITYNFPQGWVAQSVEAVHTLNARKAAAMKVAILQQHPELADRTQLSVPQFLLYASPNGRGDIEHLSVPCLRITASRTRAEALSLDTFDELTGSMAEAQNLKLISPAAKFTVKDHDFLRADFQRSNRGSSIYEAYVQTISGDYQITIEMFASSDDELGKIAATLQSMVIVDE